jgi:hypothetical protein
MFALSSFYIKPTLVLPMPLHSTPTFSTRSRLKRVHAQPSEATIEFLKNFARTYVPGMELPNKKAELVLN